MTSVFILAPEKPLWHNPLPKTINWDFPKVMIPLSDKYRVLDYDMYLFNKFGLDINIVVGYKADFIKQYCKDRGYKVNFVNDDTYFKSYNAGRTFMSIKNTLLDSAPLITSYGDNIVLDYTFKEFLGQEGDICTIDGKVALMKFNKHGIEEFYKMIETFDLTLHQKTLNMYGGKGGDTHIFNTLYAIKEKGSATWKNMFGPMNDIDMGSDRHRILELVEIREFISR